MATCVSDRKRPHFFPLLGGFQRSDLKSNASVYPVPFIPLTVRTYTSGSVPGVYVFPVPWEASALNSSLPHIPMAWSVCECDTPPGPNIPLRNARVSCGGFRQIFACQGSNIWPRWFYSVSLYLHKRPPVISPYTSMFSLHTRRSHHPFSSKIANSLSLPHTTAQRANNAPMDMLSQNVWDA